MFFVLLNLISAAQLQQTTPAEILQERYIDAASHAPVLVQEALNSLRTADRNRQSEILRRAMDSSLGNNPDSAVVALFTNLPDSLIREEALAQLGAVNTRRLVLLQNLARELGEQNGWEITTTQSAITTVAEQQGLRLQSQ